MGAVADYPADLTWVQGLRSGSPVAWARFRKEVEPGLPYLPGLHPGRQTQALYQYLRTGRAGSPDPMGEYKGRVPFTAWVEAVSVRLQRNERPVAPTAPAQIRAAVTSAFQDLDPSDQILLAKRYLEPGGPFECARRKAANEEDPSRILGTLRRMRRKCLDHLGDEGSFRQRQNWLAAQAPTATDALIRSLEIGNSLSVREGQRMACAGLFSHLSPEWLACEKRELPLPPEQKAHLASCTYCNADLIWLTRRVMPTRRRALALGSLSGALFLGALTWTGLWKGGEALMGLFPKDSAEWSDVRRAGGIPRARNPIRSRIPG